MTTRGRAMEEILAILHAAWSGEVFRHEGAVYQLPKLAVRPTPQSPIPIVIGGGAEVAIRRAARKANGIFSNALPAGYLEQVAWARDELGDSDEFRWLHYSILYPCDDPAEGWEELKPHLWSMAWKYSDMEASATRSGPVPEAPPLVAEMEDRLRERAVIVGRPDDIVEQLMDIVERSQVPTRFMARSYFHTMGRSQQLELMERLATDVAPHLP